MVVQRSACGANLGHRDESRRSMTHAKGMEFLERTLDRP